MFICIGSPSFSLRERLVNACRMELCNRKIEPAVPICPDVPKMPDTWASAKVSACTATAMSKAVLTLSMIQSLSCRPSFSPIIMHAALMFPLIKSGITDASAIQRFSSPLTLRSGVTTAFSSTPMRQVPDA